MTAGVIASIPDGRFAGSLAGVATPARLFHSPSMPHRQQTIPAKAGIHG